MVVIGDDVRVHEHGEDGDLVDHALAFHLIQLEYVDLLQNHQRLVLLALVQHRLAISTCRGKLDIPHSEINGDPEFSCSFQESLKEKLACMRAL